MKWFKHLTDASKAGELIAEIEDVFGLEGYARYFKLLEAVAYKMDSSDKCSAAYPWSKWQTFLKAKRNKLETFLVYLENKLEINLKQTGNILEIEIPKLALLRDNHTKNLQVTSKQLAPRERIKNKNKDKEIERVKVTPLAQPTLKKTKGTRLSNDWEPSETLKQWAEKERPDLKLNGTIDAFRDYWVSVGGQNGVKLDWDATFRNWVRREKPATHSFNGPVAPIRKFTETREVPL